MTEEYVRRDIIDGEKRENQEEINCDELKMQGKEIG